MPQQESPQAIIVPGSGLHLSEPNKFGVKLSWDTRMRVYAARHRYQLLTSAGISTKIILCGGEVYPGQAPISQVAQAITLRSNRKVNNLPEQDVLTVDKSRNTLEDLRSARDLIASLGIENGSVVSNGYHLVAEALAQKYGFEFITAEAVLDDFNSHGHRLNLYDLDKSAVVQALKRQQMILSALIRLPFGEKIYQRLSEKTLSSRAVISNFDPHQFSRIRG